MTAAPSVVEIEREVVMATRERLAGAIYGESPVDGEYHVDRVLQTLRSFGVIDRRVSAELRRAVDDNPRRLPGGASSSTEINRPRPHHLGQEERGRGQTEVSLRGHRDEAW